MRLRTANKHRRSREFFSRFRVVVRGTPFPNGFHFKLGLDALAERAEREGWTLVRNWYPVTSARGDRAWVCLPL